MNSNEREIQAAEWLARLDRDDATPEDLAAFDRWKATDPRNAGAYARLAATWQALERIRAIRPSADEPIDNDYLNGALQQHPSSSSPNSLPPSVQHLPSEPLQDSLPETGQHAVADSQDSPRYPSDESSHDSPPYSVHESSRQLLQGSSPQRPRKGTARHPPWLFLSLAASILLVFAGLWIAHTSDGPQTYRTGIGGFQRIVLEDQSAIELNTDSEVRVALSPQMRKVELVRGEAGFEVAHDASRPFIVSASKTAIRAVGTKFDVHRMANSVEVIVDEGKVLVGAPEMFQAREIVVLPSMLPLVAGQAAISSDSGVKLTTLRKSSIARKLAWQNQMLVFDGDSLAEVIGQFNRYNERQLVIADPSVATIRIGGYFRPTNLDAFVSVLQSDFGIRVNLDGNRLVLAASTIK
jgi:transmembrane sensor